MKRCKICGIEKDESDFYKDKSKKDGLRGSCKSCSREYEMRYRETHRDELQAKSKLYREQHKTEIKEWQKNYREKHKGEKCEYNCAYQSMRRLKNKEKLYALKTPCAKCGEDRAYVLDFHHIDPEHKSFNISTMGSRHTDVEISAEVKKCVCLCRNCHQEFHHFYGKQPKNPVEALEQYLGKKIIELLGGE